MSNPQSGRTAPVDNQGRSVVLRSDALSLPLRDDSVDLVVTSPPYFALRSYQDGGEHYDGQIGSEPTPQAFIDALLAVTSECVRVLKPSGSLWLNLGDKYSNGGRASYDVTDINGARGGVRTPDGFRAKTLLGLPWRYALACIDQLGLILRAEIIWNKPNGLPESVTDRVRRSHEQWFHLTLHPHYFADVDEVREQYATTFSPYRTKGKAMNGGLSSGSTTDNTSDGLNPLGKLPSSVWTVPTAPLVVPDYLGVDHFAAFPPEFPRRIILGWSPANGVVLDPFGGTGTTAMVARALGRTGVSVDLSADYCRLAHWRTNDAAQIAKVRCEPFRKPERQLDGQEDLFGGAA